MAKFQVDLKGCLLRNLAGFEPKYIAQKSGISYHTVIKIIGGRINDPGLDHANTLFQFLIDEGFNLCKLIKEF